MQASTSSTCHRLAHSFLRCLLVLAGLSVMGATQTLTWSEPSANSILPWNLPRALTAVAGSGLPVSFRIVRGPAEIIGSTLIVTNVGTVEVVAEQAGNASFEPVSETRVFNRSSVLATSLAVPAGLEGLTVKRVTTQGSLVFLCGDTQSVGILDIPHDSAPVLVSRFLNEFPVHDIAVDGNLMVLASASALTAYDISNPALPILLSTFPLSGAQQLHRVALGGGIACVTGNGPATADFVDYRNPAQPIPLGSLPVLSNSSLDLASIGRVFAVANFYGGLYLFDASDPAAIRQAFHDPWVGNLTGVGVSDDRLMVALEVGGLALFDVATPTTPTPIAQWRLPDTTRAGFSGLAFGRQWTLAADSRRLAVEVYSAWRDGVPESLGTISQSFELGFGAHDVGLVEPANVAVVAAWDSGVFLLGLREGIGQSLTFTPPSRVLVDADAIPLEATASSGLPVVFELVSGQATLSGSLLTPTGPGPVRVRAVQPGTPQLLRATLERTINVEDPPEILRPPGPATVVAGVPTVLSVEASPEPPPTYQWQRSGTAIAGANRSTLTLTRGTNDIGLYSVVVSSPLGSVTSRWVTVTAGPRGEGFALQARGLLGGLTVGGGSGATIRFRRRGNHLWLANGWETALRVYDVKDPDRPVQLTRLDAPTPFNYSFDLALVDDIALVAERGSGLGIVDISNPAVPVRIGSMKLPGSLASSITVVDRVAYIGNEDRLTILDVDRPRSPVLLGSLLTRGSANGLSIRPDPILAAEWSQGLSLFDRVPGGSWALAGAFPLPGAPAYGGTAMAVVEGSDGVVYVADTTRGLRTFNTQNPSAIIERPRIGGALWGLQRVGPYLLGASGSGGIQFFNISSAANPVSMGSPFNRDVGLGARMDGNRLVQAGRELRLFDVHFVGLSPVLTGEPESRRVRPGADVTLEAPTAGTGPFIYRWFHEGNELAGVTGPVLTVTGFSAQQEGWYRVEVTGPGGVTEGPVARLLGLHPPRIQAGSVQLSENEVLHFRVEAEPGQRVGVMVSPDLRSWTERAVLTASEASLEVRDEGVAASERYFRVEAR